MTARIEDYALIGDLQAAALVSRHGSIDWLCLPNFSSPACFAALLGDPSNGRWRMAPTAHVKHTERSYRDGTLILDTIFETAAGAVQVTDFMPVRGKNPDVVRLVRGLRGTVQMLSEVTLRFDYGRAVPWVTAMSGGVRAISGPDMAVLRSPVKSRGKGLNTVSKFSVKQGQTVPFVLTYSPSHLPLPKRISWRQALADTEKFWREWSAKSRYRGSYKSAVERSLITLKALTYEPTGGIVAAPTTSLPEHLGGQRNWDYRYCWLRDTTFTLLALMDAGYLEEARSWRDWLLRALAGSAEQVQIMYGLHGERQLQEWEVPWLKGYGGAKPVRIGNAASEQLQLDIYGEVLDAIFHGMTLALKEGRKLASVRGNHTLDLLGQLLMHLEKVWRLPDQGIWEMRSAPRHYTYSKLMAWVAFDRAVRIAELRHYRGWPVARWSNLRDQIHAQICRKAYNPRMKSFTQSYGSRALDASLLLMPLVGFLPHDDPRILGTLAAIENGLMKDGLVLRYDTRVVNDGLPAGEGVFLACSFWMVSNLAQQGRLEEAHAMFERLIGLSNDLGLLSEEYDPRNQRLLGNFPQAFSHISLLNAAFALERSDALPQRALRLRNPSGTSATG
jgi:GH15 family glucan-1,4-alpha-glucosidase